MDKQRALQLLADAMNVIGGVWNGSVETLAESRHQAHDVYMNIYEFLDDGSGVPVKLSERKRTCDECRRAG